MVLGDAGFTVECAGSVSAGKELLRVGSFDLVVVDKNLPDGTGFDIADYIRDYNLDCESIMITAYGSLASAIEAMQRGISDYVQKPFAEIDVIYASLARVVKLLHLKRENAQLIDQLTEKAKILEELSVHDSLTRLYNHSFVQQSIEREVERKLRFSMLLIDIDNFKQVNDALGHAAGNEVLTSIAELLRGQHGSTVRLDNHDIAARYGPDQFALLLLDTDKSAATETAERVRKSIAAFDFDVRDLPTPTVSIGVAAYPNDAGHRHELLDRVGLALYTAKRNGRNRTVAWEASLPPRDTSGRRRSVTQVRQLEALDAAIVRCDFDFVYQPIFHSATEQVFGYEALVRPRQPQFRNPMDLIMAAQASGRTRALGRSLREGSIPALAELPADTVMFVNLHPDEIGDPEILEPQPYMAPWTDRIVFEITEVAQIKDYDKLREIVQRLKRMGYRVALDDLGAGYSGLNSLTRLQPDIVKLDMELVWSIESDPRAARLVKHLIEFATEEGMSVVAEGIETETQKNAFTEMGCHLLQGYFLSKPQPLSAIIGE